MLWEDGSIDVAKNDSHPRCSLNIISGILLYTKEAESERKPLCVRNVFDRFVGDG